MGDDSVFKMSFASDAYFYKGLEGLIGPPHPLLGEAIKREHCEAQDSREPFKT